DTRVVLRERNILGGLAADAGYAHTPPETEGPVSAACAVARTELRLEAVTSRRERDGDRDVAPGGVGGGGGLGPEAMECTIPVGKRKHFAGDARLVAHVRPCVVLEGLRSSPAEPAHPELLWSPANDGTVMLVLLSRSW